MKFHLSVAVNVTIIQKENFSFLDFEHFRLSTLAKLFIQI